MPVTPPGREPTAPRPSAATTPDEAPAADGRRVTVGRRTLLALGAAVAVGACSPAQSVAHSSGTRSPSGPAGGPPLGAATPDPTRSSPSPHGTGGRATEVGHGPRGVPAVALTFHGAGDPRIAHALLASVEHAGAAVTVLAVGTWLRTYPAIGDRVRSGGHELGNHTLHHLPMAHMDEAAAYAEIRGGQKEVRRYVTTPTWFRPSGTPHATPAILAAAGRAGYATSLSYDVDPLDYTDPGASVVVSRVLSQARAGSIVSLHLGHTGTAEAMPHILAGLQRRGLTAVTVSQLLTGVTP